MTSSYTFTVNGRRFNVKSGTTVVDAALRAGIVIPTDCASGQCETCRVSVVAGSVAGSDADASRSILACQAKISGDLEIRFPEVPVPSRRRGKVSSVVPLAPDIVEVRIETDDPLIWLPGQYVKLAFKGYPSRDYSPTFPMQELPELSQLVFHIKVFREGVVSSALRGHIRNGHRVIVEGPFGSAFYRSGSTRLVLAGTGTGWAPLWAIARTARLQEPDRPMMVVVGARRPQNFYMRDAVGWLRNTGVRDLVLTCSGTGSGDLPELLKGRTTDFLTAINPDDTLYAAGSPPMVEAVKRMAAEAGAHCYSDPFTMSTVGRTFLSRLRQALETSDPSRLRPPPGRNLQSASSLGNSEGVDPHLRQDRPRHPNGRFGRMLQRR